MRIPALVYGVGNYFIKYEKEIEEKYEIVGFVDKRGGYYRDKTVYTNINECNSEYERIIIMSSNITVCFEMIDRILSQNIDFDKIMLGIALFGKYNKLGEISVSKEGYMRLSNGNLSINVSSEDEFQNTADVLLYDCYNYFLAGNSDEVVIDVGMNIGDSTLYFLKKENVKKVYAFEPVKETYLRAVENLDEYIDTEKLSVFNFGLSDITEKRKILCNAKMSCGQSTIVSTNEDAVATYSKWGLIAENETIEEIIDVKKASKIIEDICLESKGCKIVLKLDCEGEEFAIIKDLCDTDILKMIDFIMLEWHYRCPEIIHECLKREKFSYYSNISDADRNMGYIYAWKC